MINILINNLFNAEKKYKLFNLKFCNFSIWSYYRMYFYYKYTSDLEIYEKSVSGFKTDFKYIKKILNIFNLKKLFEKKEYFVLEHPRSNKDKIDIYTYDIVNAIGEDRCSFFSFSHNGIINKRSNVIILDLVKIFSKIFSKIFYKLLNHNKFAKFSLFLEELKIDKKEYYINDYKRYYIELILQYYFYKFLLKVKKTKKVILVVSYYNMPLVFAAKNLNVEVIEMQHGVISKYHLGYHYPYYETDFFPDKFYTFSKFWNKSASFPGNCELISIGNSFLYNKNNSFEKIENTIIVVSQATIGNILRDYIIKNLKELKNYKIYYKLHPNEFNNYKINYSELLDYENIDIITSEHTLSELQNFCEYQIGLYSTGIYEGIEKKCKTILLNSSGIEYMEQLVEDNIVTLLNKDSSVKIALVHVKIPGNTKFFNAIDVAKLERNI